jgi:hypothetical protein
MLSIYAEGREMVSSIGDANVTQRDLERTSERIDDAKAKVESAPQLLPTAS